MVEGKIEIFLSYKEPEYRDNILWLRPYLDKEGYELLYYGAKGWTRFVPCYPESPDIEECPLTNIGPNPIGDTEGNIYEITSAGIPSCGCPD